MPAIYPNDATFNPLLMPALSKIEYTADGTRVDFNLSEPAETVGEVIAIVDGVTQSTDAYSLSNTNSLNTSLKNTLSFDDAPVNGKIVELRVIRVPTTFEVIREFPNVKTITYTGSNTTVQGNSYAIDGSQTSFSLPQNSSIDNKDDILVSTDGVTQNSEQFIFPSTTLGANGIDIGEDTSATVPFSNVASSATGIASLSITTFNKRRVRTRFQSMTERKPDRSGITLAQNFDYATFESQSGYQKRRLKSRRAKRAFQLSYTNIRGLEKNAIEEFYRARSGGFEAFIFELAHLNETGTCSVRFEGPLDVRQVLSTGTNPIDNFYTVSFSLVEVFD